MIAAVIISTTSVESVWPHVKHFITRCDGEVSTADDLYPLLAKGERLLCLVVAAKDIEIITAAFAITATALTSI